MYQWVVSVKRQHNRAHQPVSHPGRRDVLCQGEAAVSVEGRVDCGEYGDEDSVRQPAFKEKYTYTYMKTREAKDLFQTMAEPK